MINLIVEIDNEVYICPGASSFTFLDQLTDAYHIRIPVIDS